MKKIIALGLFLLLSAVSMGSPQGGLDQRIIELSQQIAKDMTENRKTTVAVVEFVDLRNNVTDFGRFLAEELITRLYQTKKFRVIERQLLNKVVTEQKLTLTGVIDPVSAKKLGKLLGVDAIVSGTITDLGQSLRVNARLISTETGEVFSAASTEIFKDGSAIFTPPSISNSNPSPSRSQANKPDKNIPQKIEAQFFTFELQQCRLSGTTVICDLQITNNEKDKGLTIDSETKLFDDLGNESKASHFQLANNEYTYYARSFLVSGVSTKARLTFNGVSAQATKATLIEVACYTDLRFVIKFRDVPLLGQNASKVSFANPKPVGQAIHEQIFTLNANQQWMDTGVDVEPGMRLDLTANGNINLGNNLSSDPSGVATLSLMNLVLPLRKAKQGAVIAKIRLDNGKYSNTLSVGVSNRLTVQNGEQGRLLLGINDSPVTDNSGSYTVKLRW